MKLWGAEVDLHMRLYLSIEAVAFVSPAHEFSFGITYKKEYMRPSACEELVHYIEHGSAHAPASGVANK